MSSLSLSSSSSSSSLPPSILFLGQSNAAGRSRYYAHHPPLPVIPLQPSKPPLPTFAPVSSRTPLRQLSVHTMFNDCDPKKNSLGYSPLNYLYPLYAHHHNFARGGTYLSEWLANYDSWVVAPWSRSSSGSASLKTDVVWIQGESDVANSEASYTDYHENLTTFVNKLKATVNINTLTIVLTTTTRTSLLKLPHSPKLLRSCQSRISEADFGFKINIVDTFGIRMCDDGVHYTSSGSYDVSVRLRAVLLPSPTPTPSPSPASLNVEEWKATMDKSAVELSKVSEKFQASTIMNIF